MTPRDQRRLSKRILADQVRRKMLALLKMGYTPERLKSVLSRKD